ncbi:MFS general substrate transporter [Polychaeton citri CBS 116435]|uniref:MFS general substrate transporter n=1 Tax=Polychaeton citri CBS 116435 TaxID=1314669 RepID=A0A9P4QCK7_9PEZI|nr:MFS general substrate transporter [Polychaeton citri CBS 116435]
MKIVQFMNPFATHHPSEFPDVVIPMQHARRHSSIVSKHNSKSGDTESASSDHNVLTVESLLAEIEDDLAAGGHDTAYDRKSKVINKAIQDIGMGRYQWELFVLCGFGWLADNLWLQGVALVLDPVANEFGVDPTRIRYTTLALFLGLCLGASGWGIASDVIGRRLAFNATLFLTGVFGLAAGGAPNWIGLCALFSCLGLGLGGNLPVDGALFLEFLPHASGNLLTLLSVFWPLGQLIGSLIAWPLIANFSCEGPENCTKADNWGWRYFILTIGAITFLMFVCRFFLFHLYESPKFLLSKGRQTEAVAVVYGIAHHNKTKTWLTEEILNAVGGDPEMQQEKKNNKEIVKESLSKFSTERLGPLFNGWKLGLTTVLLWWIWTCIGMGYPLFNAFLPQYLGGGSVSINTQYRNYAITSAVGVPGSIIACFTVNIRYIGRKGTMAIATVITGVFVFLFTVSRDSSFQLAFSSLEAFFQNIMYGVLYAYTPEVFPAPNRGSGTGVCSFLNRLAGLCAPIIAVNAGAANPVSPIYASGALFFAAFIAMLALPIETRGKQSL